MNKAPSIRRHIGSHRRQAWMHCFPALTLVAVVLMCAVNAEAAIQYWDSAATAGYQHGDGVWSTVDANWRATATAAAAVWTNNNQAYFSATNGASLITLDSAVTSTGLIMNGSAYTLEIRNGGALSNSLVDATVSSLNNTLLLTGGAGVTSLWNNGGRILYLGSGNSTNNSLIIDGKGTLGSAVVTNISTLSVGHASAISLHPVNHSVIVTNGGVLQLGVGSAFGVSGAPTGHGIGVAVGNVNTSRSNSLVIAAGGRVYASGALFVGINGYNATLTGNRLEVRDAGSLLDMRGNSIYAPYSYAANAVITSGVEVVVNGGTVTNVGSFIMPNRMAGNSPNDNRLTVTNGGTFYTTNTSSVGNTAGTNNVAVISGAGSRWDLTKANLLVGNGTTATNNVLAIDQGGMVANVGSFTIYSNNFVNLLGGTLSVSNLTCNNGSVLNIGDGTQAAELVMQGGTHTNNLGLLIQSNATVSGRGRLAGGSSGVTFAAGSTLRPGIPGSAATTIATLQLGPSTWQGGSTLEMNVTNVTGTAGTNWDYVQCLGSMNFVTNGGKLKIKLNSAGETAGGFDSNVSRVIPLVACTNAAIALSDIELNTNDFLIGSNWFVDVNSTDIRCVYSQPQEGVNVAGVYVSTTGDNSDGTTWSKAYTTLSNALTHVQNGDTVYVAGQTFNITAQVVVSNLTGISIRGGYQAASDAILPGPQDSVIWPTILKASGTTRVMYLSGLTNSLLKGLTLRDGLMGSSGVGVFMTQCSGVTLDGCVIVNNQTGAAGSSNKGAGLYASSSTLTLTNCVIATNTASAGINGSGIGGGIYLESGMMTVTDCRVSQNIATVSSGGNGVSFIKGGGIWLGTATTSTIMRTVVDGNTCNQGGGGIFSQGSLTLANSIVVRNNSTSDLGDGIYLESAATSKAVILNCTIADNSAIGVQYSSGTVTMSNTIVRGHSDDIRNFPNNGATPPVVSNVSFCCIQDGDNNGVQGCVSIDPMFADTNYFHLQSKQGVYGGGYFSGGLWTSADNNSPLIDAGDPSSESLQEPAPNGGRINLGAYGNTPVASKTDITTIFTLPVVANPGATLIGHRTARLNAVITDTGKQIPSAWFHYWDVGNGTTSVVGMGLQPGVFDHGLVGLTPGSSYAYYVVASNSVGAVTSTVSAFVTHAAAQDMYVATNGNNTAGTNWSTAYTDLQRALDIIEDGDTVYLAGHTFARSPDYQQVSLWTWSGDSAVTIVGGYQAASDDVLPGPRDPASWPTVLRRVSGAARILYFDGLTNCTLRGLAIRDGSNTAHGAGMYIANSQGLTLDGCTIVSNQVISGSAQGGAGIYAASSSLTLTNCFVAFNSSKNSQNAYGLGGGVYLASGVLTVSLSRVSQNTATGSGAGQEVNAHGGGFWLGSATTSTVVRTVVDRNSCSRLGGGIFSQGRLDLVNSLLVQNNSVADTGDGLCVTNAATGKAVLLNCTVADNGNGVGILYGNGTIAMTNTIVWGHNDDIRNFPNDGGMPPVFSNVSFSCIKDGDNSGVQGCMQLDPLFADSNYYHLQSVQGYYSNAFFSGGNWVTALSNSPCIDTGANDSDYANEPLPNGGRINMGAYGGTEVASKTEAIEATLPVVTNRGATIWGHRTVRLSAEVLDTGGSIPQCGFFYWITGDNATSTIPLGLKDGFYRADVAGLMPGNLYRFVAFASNGAGQVLSAPVDFATHPVASSLYISTNGNNTAGTNWFTAYTNLQEALDIIEDGDTVYLAGHTFARSPVYQEVSLWNWANDANVTIMGGFQAVSDVNLPGLHDPATWPTVLQRASDSARILYFTNLVNCVVRGITVRGGSTTGSGAGLYLSGSQGVTLDNCTFVSNVLTSGGSSGGAGIYAASSTLALTNCLIAMNTAGSAQNAAGVGGGVKMESGVLSVTLCRVSQNASSGYGAGNESLAHGGGFWLGSATTSTIARTVIDRNTCNKYGGGIYAQGRVLDLVNSLVISNGASEGIHVTGATATANLLNCTVANNSGKGVNRLGGTVAATNSIFWGNGDDLLGAVSVAYCDIQTPDAFWTNGVNGCISADPLFDDLVYYHLQSKKGVYRGGYFSGGAFGSYSASNSPGLDAGTNLPSTALQNEPMPNGRFVNMGAYGGTSVASISPAPGGTVFMIR